MLVGRNGAGKTTLMRTIVGLERPSSGRVEIAGFGIRAAQERRDAIRRIGYVPQAAAIPPSARVTDILAYAAWLKGVPAADTRTQGEDALEQVSLADFHSRRVGTLSGGERQRLSIAMALVHRPDVLVLDEPSVGLDLVQRAQLTRIIDRLGSEHAVLLSTHLVEDISETSGRIVVIRDGQIRFTGTPADVGEDLGRGLWQLLGGDGA